MVESILGLFTGSQAMWIASVSLVTDHKGLRITLEAAHRCPGVLWLFL